MGCGVDPRCVESNDGSVDTSARGTSNKEPSNMENLMDMLESPDNVDGVLESVDTLVISVSQATDETLAGVDIGAMTSGTGVGDLRIGTDVGDLQIGTDVGDLRIGTGVGDLRIEIDRVVGVSEIGESLSADETTEPLGRRKDVSKEVSNPSARAMEPTDGEARKIDDSYEILVSAAQGEGLGGDGVGDDGAGDEGVRSRSDSVRLVIVVKGGTVGVVVGVWISVEIARRACQHYGNTRD
jgi:hypothetical protein